MMNFSHIEIFQSYSSAEEIQFSCHEVEASVENKFKKKNIA